MVKSNHIEQLIQNLCPSGVEYKMLGEVTIWDKQFKEVDKALQPETRKYHYYLANELEALERNDGDIRILYTAEDVAYTYSSLVEGNIADAEVVAIPWGGNATIKYFKGKFVTADNRIAISRDTSIADTKYLYYWLLANKDTIETFYRGAGIKHPSMRKVLTFPTPIPPMQIQKEIVRILDAFSNLLGNIDQEIQARQKQLDDARAAILTAVYDSSKELLPLGKVCFYPKERILACELNVDNYVGVENLLQKKQGVTKSSVLPDTSAIKYIEGDVLIGNIRPYLRKIWLADRVGGTNGDVVTLRRKDEYWYAIDASYLYHILADERFFMYDIQFARGAKMPRGNKEKILEYSIPVPPIAEQRAIAEKLDTIEAFINNLKTERDLRQQQYEYYREHLINLLK